MEVFLDENLTNKYSRSAFRTLEPSIDLIVLNASRTSPLHKRDLKELISKDISLYGGLYFQILEKLPNTPSNKIISASLASKMINNKSHNDVFLNIDLSTNNKLLVSSIENLNNYSWKTPNMNLEDHFSKLNSTFDNLIEKYNINEVKLKTKNQTISSKQEIKNTRKGKTNQNIKELNEYNFSSVKKEEIIGNKKLIDILENRVSNLLHYNNLEKENVFDFNQFSLLFGPPGNGKTYISRYILTHAKKIANENKIPFSVVTLDFEDRWQNGPVENIKYQLSQISKGDKSYIVFIDELDLKFPTRTNNNSRSQEQVLGEILKFRGGSYQNLKNYLFLTTTNRKDRIDYALNSIFSKHEIKASSSIDEKLEIFKLQIKNKNLRNKIDWKEIKPYLDNKYLTNRSLQLTGQRINEEISKLAKNIPYNISNKEKREQLNNIINNNQINISTKSIIENLNNFSQGDIYES